MHLYFIALIPHQALREEIRRLKEEIQVRFNAKHALKSPAHITLQMPFKRSRENEPQIMAALENFAKTQHSLSINLSGFGHFSNRVIYVRVENPSPIIDLHKPLNQLLIHLLDFQDNEISKELHPHMTLATRDLHKSAFKKAWAEFQHRAFQDSFEAKSLFLLRHNGKYWDILQEFSFDKA